MFAANLPTKKIGCLSPRTVVDNGPYEFYKYAPPSVIQVVVSCGLEEFSAEEVERVFKPLMEKLDMLVERDVDIIVQTGVPLPLLIGMEAHDELLKKIEAHTKIPATSQIINVNEALKHLGLKNVLVVNKWSDEMNAVLKDFLARDGIATAGVFNKSLTPREFSRMPGKDSAQLAYDLGKAGLEAHPEADGLYIGGGNWLSQPVCDQLEKEFDKPVICNAGAHLWNLLSVLGEWKPIPGEGRLFSSS